MNAFELNVRRFFSKEKQDLEVEFLKGKVRDLGSQVEGLQWQLEEVEERTRTETDQLQVMEPCFFRCNTSPLLMKMLRLSVCYAAGGSGNSYEFVSNLGPGSGPSLQILIHERPSLPGRTEKKLIKVNLGKY